MDKRLMFTFCNNILNAGSAFVRGKIGEKMVFHMLKWQGYQVYEPDGRCQGDIKVIDQTTGEAIRVEVKTARANVRGKYQFCLKKDDKYGGTDCRRADVVVLVAVTKSGSNVLFVIPADECKGRQITISGNPHEYRGKYLKFRQYHNTLNLRTDVHKFSHRIATDLNPVYAG